MSTFGTLFRVTTFGESHCRGVGAIIDGCPPMLALTEADVQPQLTRRRPGQSKLTTPRSEKDCVTILSGTERGMTLGTPIGLFVPNENVRPGDYKEMSTIPRPGHADYTYQVKYGIRAASGGGRSSARETIGRVAAGAIAEKWLHQTWKTSIVTFVSAVGTIELDRSLERHPSGRAWTRSEVDNLGRLRVLRSAAHWKRVEGATAAEHAAADAADEAAFVAESYGEGVACYQADTGELFDRHGKPVAEVGRMMLTDEVVTLRCPHAPTACAMASLIRDVKSCHDSTGGVLTTVVTDVPVGLGEPCFDKLEAMLAHAMLSLPATKGFEIGTGFAGTRQRGSTHNDAFVAAGTAPTAWSAAADAAAAAVEERAPAAAAARAGASSASTAAAAAATAHSQLAAPATVPPSEAHPSLGQGRVLLRPATNNAGGTLGGVSTGAEIVFRVAIKPVSTIGREQATAAFEGTATTLAARGRHDPCVLPRAPPLVEGMAALVLADAALLQRSRREPVTLAQVAAAGKRERGEEDASGKRPQLV